MKGKLIKFPYGDWVVEIPENNKGITGSMMQHFASTFGHGYKLSLKNCQAIERGYDLDEYIAFELQAYIAEKHNQDECTGFMDGYETGFQKALELLGDKKYSEKDMEKAYSLGWGNSYEFSEGQPITELHEFIQSPQQTEWDVEVEMENGYDGLDEMAQPQYYKKPKLDEDGCLILKLKSE